MTRMQLVQKQEEAERKDSNPPLEPGREGRQGGAKKALFPLSFITCGRLIFADLRICMKCILYSH